MTQTLAQGIANAATSRPTARAIEFEGRWIDWSQMLTVMDGVEALLAKAGLGAATPVAMLLRNRPAMLAAALQALRSDRCVVTINPFQSPDKVATDMRNLRCPAIVADAQDWALEPLRQVAAETGALAIEVGLLDGPSVHALPGLDKTGPGPFHDAMAGTAVLMLSSGTTGPAKRIKLPYRQLEQAFASAAAYETKRPGAGDGASRTPAILAATMVHIGGLYFSLDAVLAGRPIALLEKFNVPEYSRVLREHRPKMITLPPSAMRMMLDAEVDPELFSSVKAVRAGSAPLSVELKSQFESTFKVPVLDVYGATEFAGAVAGWSLDDHRKFDKLKPGSVGRAQRGIELRVVDPASGAVLPPGQQGILEIRSRQTNPDTWVRTTDLADIDADGFLFIRGRADDAIIRGGFKVLPREIEAVLRAHPAVQEASVVGLPDPRLGAVPVAAVELREDAPAISESELLKFLRDKVVAYQVPTQLRIVNALPRTPSLKVSQVEVRRLFAAA
jgi:acyl-CoA synthetase (AMP-forming)/AMP-acid ligase II